MEKAEFKITVIQIAITNDNKYFFTTKIENIVFDGFLKVYNYSENNEDSNKNIKIPSPGTKLKVDKIIGNEEYDKPPSVQ